VFCLPSNQNSILEYDSSQSRPKPARKLQNAPPIGPHPIVFAVTLSQSAVDGDWGFGCRAPFFGGACRLPSRQCAGTRSSTVLPNPTAAHRSWI
jgi:hypothetical protein